MSDETKEAPKGAEPKKQSDEVELNEADLGDVAGGLNPQPLPPGIQIIDHDPE
jgi:hypothetical protein